MLKGFSLNSFSAGIALGIVAATAWYLWDPHVLLTPHTGTKVEANTQAATDSGALAVSNQNAGSSVVIDSITVPPPGAWVAVRDTSGSNLGNVLGALYVSGPRSNFSVPLLRATASGHTYAVELYRDDGSGAFDPGLSVYVDFDSGEPVISYFKTN